MCKTTQIFHFSLAKWGTKESGGIAGAVLGLTCHLFDHVHVSQSILYTLTMTQNHPVTHLKLRVPGVGLTNLHL